MGITVVKPKTDRVVLRLRRKMSPVGVDGYFLLLQQLNQFLQGTHKKLFKSEGASGPSGAWEPLHPRTEEIRMRLNYGAAHPINQRTKDLMNMVTASRSDIAADGRGGWVLQFPGSAQNSTPHRRRAMKQAMFGTKRAPTARPVVQLGPEDLGSMLAMSHRFFTEPLR